MRVLIQTTPWHEERYSRAKAMRRWLLGQGADSELLEDNRPVGARALEPTGFLTFVDGLASVGDEGAWFVEDDADLTMRFVPIAEWEAKKRSRSILQAYSTEKADVTRGERYRTGASFGSNLCVHYPGPVAKAIVEFAKTWEKPEDRPHREKDVLVRSWLVANGLDYWQIVPSLATPLPGFSVRQGRRFTQPPSPTFQP